MEVLKCDIGETDETETKPYKYTFEKVVENDGKTLYIYDFKYNSSGLEMLLALTADEVLWLVDKETHKLDKFLNTLDEAFKHYVQMLVELYREGGIQQ